ncbi:hypothetical protein [uncultured Desulfovibrio sp.]|uniref:hypothetical protein n=1 Tax=uncultured Desulfovibrio sp. TaxID=167968 RepID=UPI00263492C6|nr:hypothetical protein [uncultured Desulfovibrio sp.]
MTRSPSILIRGAGEMATGIALHLSAAGFERLALQECPCPTAIRRGVCFSEAVAEGRWQVREKVARHLREPEQSPACWAQGEIPVLTCAEEATLHALRPDIFIEATLRKRPVALGKHLASLVLALGPGFTAGQDAHLVVETHPAHCGEILASGMARAPEGEPAAGQASVQHLRAPADGHFRTSRRLGDRLEAGAPVGFLQTGARSIPLYAPIPGMLRGLLRDGTLVRQGRKVADMDDRPHITPQTLSSRATTLGRAVTRLVRQWLQGDAPYVLP